MGSIIGHRIDYDRVGALRGQRHIPVFTKINPSAPHREITGDCCLHEHVSIIKQVNLEKM